jgi:hypothetical protein
VSTVSVSNLGSAGFGGEPTPSFPSTTVSYAQIGDILCIAHGAGTMPPFYFTYINSPTSGKTAGYYCSTVAAFPFLLPAYNGYVLNNIPWSTPYSLGRLPSLNPNGTSGGAVTVTSSGPLFYSSAGSGIEWVGRGLRLCRGSDRGGSNIIASWTNDQNVVIYPTSYAAPAAAYDYGHVSNPTSFWQSTVWDQYSGYPCCVAAYQGRFIFGGSTTYPTTIWGTRAGNFLDMLEIPDPSTTGVGGYASNAYANDNTRPFSATVGFDSGKIIGLSAGKVLTILTEKCEISCYGTDGGIGPNNIQFDSSTAFGSKQVVPIRTANFLTFVQKSGRRIRDVIYSFNEDQYKSNNLSIQAEHYFETSTAATGYDQIKEIVRFENGISIMFVLTTSGKLFGVNLDRDFNINAWCRIALSKSSTDYPTAPYDNFDQLQAVQTMCASDDGTELVVLVNRDSGNYLCKIGVPYELQNPFVDADSITDRPVFLDFSSVAEAAAAVPTTSWNARTSSSFTNRYGGKTISVVADGNYIGEVAVNNDTAGTFTLPVAASHVLIGYKYRGILKTMPLQQGGQWGTPVGRFKRVDELVIRFLKSCGAKFGKSVSELFTIPFRSNSQLMGQATDYFTGDKVVTFPPGYERNLQIVIVQDVPYPCYITSVTPRGVTYD